ncbi:MAG: hypothetical protein Ct9H90mP5_09640 [Acidimicrobiaceae bacterium]|nr:MAG: hypothetical protein Ct9H90mP5_09640 [Acidimicrobiaceae bacterium]
MVISGIRCAFTYVIFPILAPALGIASGVGSGIGLVASIIGIAANLSVLSVSTHRIINGNGA